MLTRVKFSLLTKAVLQRSFQRIPKLLCLQRGYQVKLSSSYFELAKQAVLKSRTFIPRDRVNSRNEEEIIVIGEEKENFFSFLWEIVLTVNRIIVISIVFSGLLTFYWITRVFRLQTHTDVYLQAIEFLGPTFVKLGQWMSMRRDIYPEEVCRKLSRLQRGAPAHSWHYTRHLLEAAYGPKWRELFIEFDRVPLGSGCCAQVHRALLDHGRPARVKRDIRTSTFVDSKLRLSCLRRSYQTTLLNTFMWDISLTCWVRNVPRTEGIPNFALNLMKCVNNIFLENQLNSHSERKFGSPPTRNVQPVAVKILHPLVKERLKRDLSILRFLSKCVTCLVPSLEWLSITDCINDFSQIMEKQVDLDLESRNLAKFSRHFSANSQVCFPAPFYHLSSDTILVETFHEGRYINDYLNEKDYKLRHKLAKIGLHTVFKMIFEDNFVHCDLHPGNILVQELGEHDKLRVVILDCGLVAELSESCRKNFRDVFESVVSGDGKRAANLMMIHSAHESPDPAGFVETMDNIVKSHLQRGMLLENINLSNVMSELFSAMVRYQVKQDGSFSSVVLSVAVIEGLGRSLDPNIDLIRELSPFLLSSSL